MVSGSESCYGKFGSRSNGDDAELPRDDLDSLQNWFSVCGCARVLNVCICMVGDFARCS